MVFATALGTEEQFGVVGLEEDGGYLAIIEVVVCLIDSDYSPLLAGGIVHGDPLAQDGRTIAENRNAFFFIRLEV